MLTSILKTLQFHNLPFRKKFLTRPRYLPLRVKIILAFGAIYFIWGSTYLAIRFAVETIPPFFMMGSRSLLAGGILYAWSRWRGEERPKLTHWVKAAIIGSLLFLGGLGALAWGEQTVPSGVAALIIATNPVWMTLLQAFISNDNPLTLRVIFGLAVGLGGVFFLVEPSKILGGMPVDPVGTAVLLIGTLLWAIGAVYSKHAVLPESSTLVAGMTLLCGGGALLCVSFLSREELSFLSVSSRSVFSVLYLIVFGSIIALTAYFWLLKKTTPSKVSTHAYVNPVVAILVGWLAGGEFLSPRIMMAALLMVMGVAAILTRNTESYSSVKKLKFYDVNKRNLKGEIAQNKEAL